MSNKPIIVWLRNDLRNFDNPALQAAALTEAPILPLYILDDAAAGKWQSGSAARWWLHQALNSLELPLVLRSGDSLRQLSRVIDEVSADSVYWNRRYEPWAIAQDKAVKSALRKRGLTVRSFAAHTLKEPWQVTKGNGEPYKVFTPFSRNWLKLGMPRLPSGKARITEFARSDGLTLDELRLWPADPDWTRGLAQSFTASEKEAEQRLTTFCQDALFSYAKDRDNLAQNSTSCLSAYLSIGILSPHRVCHTAINTATARCGSSEPALPFVRQLIWRDFAYSCLYHFPKMHERPLRHEFNNFSWSNDNAALHAWQRGQTGFPIIDAGMRQLWQTGYLSNRLRMLVGSFLTKDLLVHWHSGAEWFWDRLADADLANNSMGWQWVAGCGIDAAPFFRIFNPTSQGEKFDPGGDYIRRYVPELAKLPPKWIHKPAEAPVEILQNAGLRLGEDYPHPIIDHRHARQAALDGYQQIKAPRQ